jgi:hypothetical protein
MGVCGVRFFTAYPGLLVLEGAGLEAFGGVWKRRRGLLPDGGLGRGAEGSALFLVVKGSLLGACLAECQVIHCIGQSIRYTILVIDRL